MAKTLKCPGIPTFFNLLGQALAYTLITGRSFSQAKIKMFEIEGSATTEDRDFSLCVDLAACLVCERDEIPYAELLPGIKYVDKIMIYCLECFSIGLGRPYIQMSVHLDRVGIDHCIFLRIEIHKKFSFPHARGAKQENYRLKGIRAGRGLRSEFHR